MKSIFSCALIFFSLSLFSACSNDNDDSSNDVRGGGLVSKIEVYKKAGDAAPTQTISFFYGDNNRIVAADYSGKELVCGPVGLRVHFNVEGQLMTLMFSKVGTSSNQRKGDLEGEGHGEGQLNNMGYLETSFLDATAYDIESGKYYIDTYEHNSKGQLTQHLINGRVVCKYTWVDDCLSSVSGNPGGRGYTNPIGYYSKKENKANINVNLLVFDQIFQEDIFGLSLCGYISAKDKYLLDGWETNESGYPVSYSGKYIYVIHYN